MPKLAHAVGNVPRSLVGDSSDRKVSNITAAKSLNRDGKPQRGDIRFDMRAKASGISPKWWHGGRGVLSSPTLVAMKIIPVLCLAVLASGATSLIAATPVVTYIDSFGSDGSGDGKFDFPYAVAVNGSKVYVSDFNNNRVQRFNGTGDFMTAWGSKGVFPGQFSGPGGVAVKNSGGDVYVTDIYNNRVQQFQADGTYVGMSGLLVQFNGPSGIAINQSSGDIYICEQGGNRVQRFGTGGALTGQWGGSGNGDGKFNAPDGIAVNPKTGHVYVSEFGGNRVQRFDSAGNYQAQWGSGGSSNGKFKQPVGLAIDTYGRVWVADSGNNRVQVFDANGNFLMKFGSSGSSKGKFKKPYSVAFGPGGIAFVVDNGNNRIERWQITEAPVVTINGKKKRTVTTAKTIVRGKTTRASNSPNVKSVSATVGGITYKVTGTASWNFTAKLKRGKNTITVTATDTSGTVSLPVTITVTRK